MNSESHRAIETNLAPAPVGPYNQAVSIAGWLYCSGQIALDPLTEQIVGGGNVELETKQVLNNLHERVWLERVFHGVLNTLHDLVSPSELHHVLLCLIRVYHVVLLCLVL